MEILVKEMVKLEMSGYNFSKLLLGVGIMRICWPQMAMIFLVIILGISSMLSGCGKKGPLYIPKETIEQPQAEQPQ